ncbi:hypothetical protein K461DRAFT_56646 [Myriangium duriaei CBS 260.36]|uniref:Uncharacterized protein n=1 Tax=Myriangium duriaei CBS 260.36 TaxID=1168546 RepID=A0A9P4MDC4_9PEZI|nr:hypothetical protein K461DRAFT_56646 [Myriangium duriaei CBS 260.36]
MPIFGRISDVFWQFVASPKTEAEPQEESTTQPLQKKKKKSLPGLTDLKKRHRSMSPSARIQSWHLSPPASVAAHIPPADMWEADPTIELTSPGDFARKTTRMRAAQPTPVSDGLEGSDKQEVGSKRRLNTTSTPPRATKYPRILQSVEINPAANLANSKSKSKRKAKTLDPTYNPSADIDSDHASEESEIILARSSSSSPVSSSAHPITPPRSPPADLALSSPAPTTASQVPRVSLSHFPPSTQPLVQHILLRGREPLLPSHWVWDFRFLPSSLFVPSPSPTPTLLSSLGSKKGADFRAQRALEDLLLLGPRVRDAKLTGSRPEEGAVKVLSRYLTWAYKDGGVQRARPPMVAFYAGHERESNEDLQRGIAERMGTAVGHWRRYLADTEEGRVGMPVVYGVVVCEAVVAVTCFDPMDVEGEIRGAAEVERYMKALVVLDLSAPGLDVWNALALALVIVHVRDVVRGMVEGDG